MDRPSRVVPAMSANEIEQAATKVRHIFGIEQDSRVAMDRLLDTVMEDALDGYVFTVVEDDYMPDMLGSTGLDHYEICLPNTTYEALCEGDPEARHTAAHEFGHLLLHSRQSKAMAKTAKYNELVDPEWQADYFADAWLMPRVGVQKCHSIQEVADRFTVTYEAAERRYNEVMEGEEKQGRLPFE